MTFHSTCRRPSRCKNVNDKSVRNIHMTIYNMCICTVYLKKGLLHGFVRAFSILSQTIMKYWFETVRRAITNTSRQYINFNVCTKAQPYNHINHYLELVYR